MTQKPKVSAGFLNKLYSYLISFVLEKPLVPLMEFHGNWPDDVKRKFLSDMTVIENFVSPDEEADILKEVEPYLKRMRYEVDHWDDAIQGFRETERKSWYPQNKEIISRVLSTAFPETSKTLPHIHVLDLEATGEEVKFDIFGSTTYKIQMRRIHQASCRFCSFLWNNYIWYLVAFGFYHETCSNN